MNPQRTHWVLPDCLSEIINRKTTDKNSNMKEQTLKDIKAAISQIEYHAAELNGFLSDDDIMSEDEHEELENLRGILGNEAEVSNELNNRMCSNVGELIDLFNDMIDDKDGRISELVDSIEGLDRDMEELEEQVSFYQNNIEDLKEDIKRKEDEIESLKDKVFDLEERLESIPST